MVWGCVLAPVDKRGRTVGCCMLWISHSISWRYGDYLVHNASHFNKSAYQLQHIMSSSTGARSRIPNTAPWRVELKNARSSRIALTKGDAVVEHMTYHSVADSKLTSFSISQLGHTLQGTPRWKIMLMSIFWPGLMTCDHGLARSNLPLKSSRTNWDSSSILSPRSSTPCCWKRILRTARKASAQLMKSRWKAVTFPHASSNVTGFWRATCGGSSIWSCTAPRIWCNSWAIRSLACISWRLLSRRERNNCLWSKVKPVSNALVWSKRKSNFWFWDSIAVWCRESCREDCSKDWLL